MPELTISAIPAFTDNYIWMIRTGGNEVAVVDPGEAGPVKSVLAKHNLQLSAILLTHHHPDHVGGMAELKALSGATVYGPDDARIRGVDHVMKDGDIACLDKLGLAFTALEVPGHTLSHIAFYGHDCLFCGDTLFSVGCGRLFEGTAEQMQHSLDKLSSLAPQTQLYCGHEYTVSNCQFALEVEPGNLLLKQRLIQASAARASGKPTLPSSLGEEIAVNPFLRSRQPSVVRAAQKHQADAVPGASTLGAIRAWKDAW